MTPETWLLSSVATGAAVILTIIVLLYSGRDLRRRMRRAIVSAAAVCIGGAALTSVIIMLTEAIGLAQLAPPLVGPLSAGAVFAGVLVTLPLRRLGLPRRTTGMFAAVVVVAIVVPVALGVFSYAGVIQSPFRTLDLAGALPLLLTTGLAAAVVLIAERRAPPSRRRERASWQVVCVIASAWLLWLIWLIGMELAIDEVTPRIVVNAVVAPLASLGSWLLAQRLRHDATTVEAGVAGLVSGLAAITAACGYVDLVGAAAIGLVSGGLGSLIAHSLMHRAAATAWVMPVALVVGSGTGIVSLGIFSTRVGLAYTGQPELLFSQLASLATVAVYSAVVATALWLGVRRMTPRTATAT